MRLFALIDLQHLLLGLFLGLAAALAIYLAFRFGKDRAQDEEEEEPRIVHARQLHTESNPIPPILIFVYLGFAVWLICYVIFFAFRGGPL